MRESLPRRGFLPHAFLVAVLLAGIPAGACRAAGELYPEPGGMSADYRAETRRCPRPADPRRNMMDCRLDWFDAALTAVTEFWANAREEMQLVGVTPRASLYGSFFAGAGGPVGDPMVGGTLSLSLALDIGKLAGAPKGLGFYVAGLGAWSREPWPFPVSVNYNSTNVWLTEVYVQQALLDGALTLAAGRLQPAMTFAFLPVMLNHIGPMLMSGWLAFDEPPYPPGVAAQWGVQGVWTIAHQFQLSAGVYGNNPYAARGELHGFAWQLWQGNQGVYTMGQAAWLPGAKPGADELPGLVAIGGWYDGNEFPGLGTSPGASGNYGFYLQGQQMLFRHGEPGSPRGLTAWAQVTWSPRVDTNLTPLGGIAGLSWHGFTAARASDTISLAGYAGRYSPSLSGSRGLQGIEATYDLVLTGAFSVLVDLQGVFNVNGVAGADAFIGGLQLALSL
ncbi:MAG: carbohydrate porin [Deltaproteobacteria bacterium]